MVDVRLLHILAQAVPVLRLVVGVDDAVGKMEQLSDMLLQCGGTPDGELFVMPVRTFRRCVTLQPYGGDGDLY